jgi:hypothetical protein
VLAFVTLEECSQMFFATRHFDLGDLAADFLGIAVSAALFPRQRKVIPASRAE